MDGIRVLRMCTYLLCQAHHRGDGLHAAFTPCVSGVSLMAVHLHTFEFCAWVFCRVCTRRISSWLSSAQFDKSFCRTWMMVQMRFCKYSQCAMIQVFPSAMEALMEMSPRIDSLRASAALSLILTDYYFAKFQGDLRQRVPFRRPLS